jgi:hypothetical protein
MADTDKQGTWVNTLMDQTDVEKLDIMVAENGSDRAKFIRLLVQQEWERRRQVKTQITKLQKKGLWPH